MTRPVGSTIRCVGAVIHNADGALLLVLRANDPGRGRWSLPGGRVEPGETDSQALVREITEETSLNVTVGRLCGVVTRPSTAPGRPPSHPFVIYDYACEVVGGELRAGTDAADARWVSAAEFAELDRTGALVDGLAQTLREWQTPF